MYGFIQKLPKLKVFNVNKCEIEKIDCCDWIIDNAHNKNFGELAIFAQKLKDVMHRSWDVNREMREVGGN